MSYNALRLGTVSTLATWEESTVSIIPRLPARVQGKKTPLHSVQLKKCEFSPKTGTK